MEDARTLEFDDLVQICENFVQQPITIANCIQILRCSRNLGYTDIYENSFDFLVVSQLAWSP